MLVGQKLEGKLLDSRIVSCFSLLFYQEQTVEVAEHIRVNGVELRSSSKALPKVICITQRKIVYEVNEYGENTCKLPGTGIRWLDW